MACGGGFEAYHGGFVDNEEGVGVLVDTTDGTHGAGGIGDSHVDFLVDGVGRTLGVGCDNLGGTSRGGKQQRADSQGRKGLYESRNERGLTRTGIALQEKSRTGIGIIEETCHRGTSIPLSARGLVRKVG